MNIKYSMEYKQASRIVRDLLDHEFHVRSDREQEALAIVLNSAEVFHEIEVPGYVNSALNMEFGVYYKTLNGVPLAELGLKAGEVNREHVNSDVE